MRRGGRVRSLGHCVWLQAARDIAGTISTSSNRVFLNSDSLLLNLVSARHHPDFPSLSCSRTSSFEHVLVRLVVSVPLLARPSSARLVSSTWFMVLRSPVLFSGVGQALCVVVACRTKWTLTLQQPSSCQCSLYRDKPPETCWMEVRRKQPGVL